MQFDLFGVYVCVCIGKHLKLQRYCVTDEEKNRERRIENIGLLQEIIVSVCLIGMYTNIVSCILIRNILNLK